MTADPLLSDELEPLLSAFPSDALEVIVAICKRHRSWSPFPSDRAHRAHRVVAGGEFTVHAADIARELIWWGGHEFKRPFGSAPTWRGIVADVARQVGVIGPDRVANLPVWKIELAILRKVFADWDRLSPQQREDAQKKAGINVGAGRGAAAVVAGGIARFGGEPLLKFLAVRGAGAAAGAVVAPVAAGLGALWMAHDLAGPSQRVLHPAVITVAQTRLTLRPRARQRLSRTDVMDPISITADAGRHILGRIAAGDLEVHGILLRDTVGKRFRYILRGLEQVSASPSKVADAAVLEPLRSAIGATQLLQAVTVAQNAAIAASLRRIEASLATIGLQLEGMVGRLARIETGLTLLLEATHSAPSSRLLAAKTAAVVAFQADDRTALISSGQNAEQAARDLLEQAKHLVRVQQDGVPVALFGSRELADLSSSAAIAARAASAIWLALDAREPARSLMAETADGLESIRRQVATALRNPGLGMRRAVVKLDTDEELAEAGGRLRTALHEARARELMISSGLLGRDHQRLEFEAVTPAPAGLSLMQLSS